MSLKKLDIIVMIIIAVNILWALFPYHVLVVEIFLAFPLVFILPGYALTGVFFNKRPLKALDRFILSLGLSIVIDIIGGLVLHLQPQGLQALSWVIFLGFVTIVLSLLQAHLRQGARLSVVQPVEFRTSIYPFILFILAAATILLTVFYSGRSVALQPHPGFTQFWAFPVVQHGKGCAVTIGLHSFETISVTYSITMITESVQKTSWPSFNLAPQDVWEQLVPVTTRITRNIPVKVLLYRLDKLGVVYRQVGLTLYNCT